MYGLNHLWTLQNKTNKTKNSWMQRTDMVTRGKGLGGWVKWVKGVTVIDGN